MYRNILKKSTSAITLFIVVYMAIISGTNLNYVSAHDEAASHSVQSTPQEEDLDQEVMAKLKNKIQNGTTFLNTIQTQLDNSQSELELLKSNKSKLRSKISESESTAKDLNAQLDNLAELIKSHKEKIQAVTILIGQFENQAAGLKKDVDDAQVYLGMYVQLLDKSMSAYYLQTNDFFGGSDMDPKLLAFLAYGDTTGEVVKQHDYLMTLQSATQDVAHTITQAQEDLDQKQNKLEETIGTLGNLKDLLAAQKRNLVAAQESQKNLLEQTQGKQAIYEALLEISEKEESQVLLQVERLKDNFTFFQAQLDTIKKDPSAKGIEFDSSSLSLADPSQDASASYLKGDTPLAWPVPPAQGISAFYHDSSYKAAMGVEHQAIDIRQAQGSQIRSAGDGVVTKASDNGMAYSYIIIAHPGGFLTLYGHVSDILVKEGEVVRQGEVIGLSGGMPGTKGAGWMTTGPHLHFEVFKDWKHVDPLDYLPLTLLPVSSLPEKYLNRLTGEPDADKIKRADD